MSGPLGDIDQFKGQEMLTNLFDKLKRKPDEPEIPAQTHHKRAVNLSERELYPEALEAFKQAIRAKPDYWEAYLDRGVTYFTMGRTNDAIKDYFSALEHNPDLVDAYRNLGVAYDSQGDFVKALKMYYTAMRLSPGDAELRKNLGMAYFNIGSYAEAIKAYKQAQQMDPNDASIHYHLGLVYLDLDDRQAALEELQTIQALGQDEIASLLADEIDRQSLRAARAPLSKVDTPMTKPDGNAETPDIEPHSADFGEAG